MSQQVPSIETEGEYRSAVKQLNQDEKPPIRKNPTRVFLHQSPRTHEVQDLFSAGALLYGSWLEDSDRAWQHWTQRYINYFGPRTDSVGNTYFPTTVDRPPTTRHLADPHKLAS